MAKKVTILKIGYQSFAVPNADKASKLAQLLQGLEAVEWHLVREDEDERGDYYTPKPSSRRDITMEFGATLEPRVRRRGLPVPNPDAVPCPCCGTDVPPASACPACGDKTRITDHPENRGPDEVGG